MHAAQASGEVQLHLDLFAQQPLHHGAETGDHLVEVQHLGLRHAPAAEQQQPASEFRGAFRGFDDLFGGMAVRVALAQFAEDELAVTGNDGEQIIEVVRHAAGQ